VPYYITDKSEDCPSSWAVVKEDGELIACHDSKESAIAQAIAISLAEETEFIGERAAVGQLQVGDYVSWNLSKSSNNFIYLGSESISTANSIHLDPGESKEITLEPLDTIWAVSDPTGLQLGVLIVRQSQ